MQNVARLLEEKEAALRRVKREIDALRLTAVLLAEPADFEKVQEITQAEMTAASGGSTRAGVLPFVRDPEARRPWEAFAAEAAFTRDAASHKPIFPEAHQGVIVCDACGYRNPDYVLDCERCDIPIRLRPNADRKA